jgi:Uma2 family endonuclease
MIAAGVFAHDEGFELLEGWIVPKVSRNPPHDVALDKAHEALRTRIPKGWRVLVQSAITTADSEPEPDIAIVPGPAERYLSGHPGPKDVVLVIEIADSSLTEDRRDKSRIYARAGIPLYWIVNLLDRRVEVYADPTGPINDPTYRSHADFFAADHIEVTIGGLLVSMPVVELLP